MSSISPFHMRFRQALLPLWHWPKQSLPIIIL
jgi:hypothetical protein